jgi:DNA-binding MarR family transcriptional regulator
LYLYFGEDGVTAGELSRRLKVTTPCIAAALNCLEEKDWISRKKDPSDKRKVLVYITDAGKDGIIKRHHAAVKHMAAKLSQMGEADAKEYVRLSLKMAEIESNTQPLREDGL